MCPPSRLSASQESHSNPGSGRQTLGSSHDVPQPPLVPASRPGQGSGAGHPWPAWWSTFKDRCAELDSSEAATTAARLVFHVESAWRAIRELHLAREREEAHAHYDDVRVSHLFAYIETDVIAAFVSCAEAVTRCLPSSDPISNSSAVAACHLAVRVDRGVAVACLAGQASAVSPSFRIALSLLNDALVDWGAELCTFLFAFERITGHSTMQ